MSRFNKQVEVEEAQGPKLSQSELKEFREIFSLLDKDAGGTINKEELGQLMKTVGVRATPQEIDDLFKEVDKDGSGDIDFQEFVAVMGKKVDIPYTPAQVKAAFKIFESSPSSSILGTGSGGAGLEQTSSSTSSSFRAGMVHVNEMETILKAFGLGTGKLPNSEAVKELVAQMEPNSDGLIQYSTYVDMMMGRNK